MAIFPRAFALFLLVILLFAAPARGDEANKAVSTGEWRWTLSDKTAVDRHYIFKFQPRFKRRECIIKFEYVFRNLWENWPETSLFGLFESYLWKHEPAAGIFQMDVAPSNGHPAVAYVMLSDECDRRFEIAESMAKFATESDLRYEVKASREHVLPGPYTIDNTGYWIDDPDYDPKRWKTIQKAMQGDGEAIFQMAEEVDREPVAEGSLTNLIGAYTTYVRAAECLPSGSLRDEALKRSQDRWSKMPPESRDRARNVVEINRKDAVRIGVTCNR